MFAPPLDHHPQPEIAPVQLDRGKARMRGRNSRRLEQLPADFLSQIGTVLHRIIQRDFVIAMEALTGGQFVEVERQRRVVVNRAKAPSRALEMHLDVRIDHPALPYDGFNFWPFLAVAPAGIAQGRNAGIGDQNADLQDVGPRENVVLGLFLVRAFSSLNWLGRIAAGAKGHESKRSPGPRRDDLQEPAWLGESPSGNAWNRNGRNASLGNRGGRFYCGIHRVILDYRVKTPPETRLMVLAVLVFLPAASFQLNALDAFGAIEDTDQLVR